MCVPVMSLQRHHTNNSAALVHVHSLTMSYSVSTNYTVCTYNVYTIDM